MADARAKCDGCEHQLWFGANPLICNLAGKQFHREVQTYKDMVFSYRVLPMPESECPKLRPGKIRKEGLLYIKSHSEPLTNGVQEALQKLTWSGKVYLLTDSEIVYYVRTVVEYPPVRLITSNWEPWHG